MADDVLDDAQDSYCAKHGHDEAARLWAAIEPVALGARLSRGWDGMLYYGTAMRLYETLTSVSTGDLRTNVLRDVLAKDETHAVGPLGWTLARHWHVVVLLWEAAELRWLPVRRHRRQLSESDTTVLQDVYERGLRAVVQGELVGYYFDRFEHTRDVEFAMRAAGMDHPCDAHGVGAYYGTEADIATVRRLFDDMSSVPGTMPLETYIGAIRQAYAAARDAGHGDELRQLDGVRQAIAHQSTDGRYLSDYHQRLVSPTDNFAEFARPAELLAPSGTADGAASEGLPISVDDARVIIKNVVNNIQVNQNALGIQVSKAEVERAMAGVDEATPAKLARVFKEWIALPLVGAGLGLLLNILG